MNQRFDDDAPIFFATDSHRPPPSEFLEALSTLAAHRPREQRSWGALAAATRETQVFEFGLIDDNKLVEESFRGAELYALDHLRLPFRSVAYWYHVALDPKRVRSRVPSSMQDEPIPTHRYMSLAIDADAWGLVPPGTRMIIACDWLDIESDPPLFEQFRDRIGRSRKAYLLAAAGLFSTHITANSRWHGNLLVPSSIPHEYQADALGGLGDGIVGLSMVLATRGVPIRAEEPSAKLNAKRARNGKEPLVRITHVDTAMYYEALKNTVRGGTHASPVPHLRRGHIRHLASGAKTWIRDSVVNCRSPGEALNRSHYEVEA